WNGLLRYLEKNPRDFSSLRLVTVGGAAVPPAMIESFMRLANVRVLQGWGMKETGPVAAASMPSPEDAARGWETEVAVRARQGRPLPGVRARVVNEAGRAVPWDDATMGELEVKGNWIAESYYEDATSPERFDEGWLRTGDIAVVDASGSL